MTVQMCKMYFMCRNFLCTDFLSRAHSLIAQFTVHGLFPSPSILSPTPSILPLEALDVPGKVSWQVIGAELS